MMSIRHKPGTIEGAIGARSSRPPPVFKNAARASIFSAAYGIKEKGPKEELGLIYSRLNNPDPRFENRLTLWEAGMKVARSSRAVLPLSNTTVMLEFLSPK